MITASEYEVAALKLRNVIKAEPAARYETYVVYAPAVLPVVLLETFTMIVSLMEIVLFVKMNETAAPAANAASCMVMRPADLFKVTPVDLLVIWVTVP